MCADIDVRPVTEAELADWYRAVNTGFLRPPTPAPETVALKAAAIDFDRTLGAFDGTRCVAAFRSFSQQITAVGGGTVVADAVSNVAVTPTHRRRGLLSRMMETDLAAARERGDVLATLIAAEYPIYGRFGFGPAASVTEWEVDVPRTGLDPRWAAPQSGRIELVDGDTVRKVGPALHERFRAAQHGAIDRDERWWRTFTGEDRTPEWPWTEPFYALYRGPGDEVEGLLVYRADDTWGDTKQPHNTATVRDLIAVNPTAERALWHFVCSVDWVTTVRSGYRAADDLLPDLLPNPRAARIATRADWLWVRILDVVRALEARTYAGEGTLVLEVTEPETGALGGRRGGRYRLDAGRDGAGCVPTTASPSLVLGVAELGSLWLGEESAVRLAALGKVGEERSGAAATADALFRTSRKPWCPDVF